MCGIAGLIGWKAEAAVQREIVSAMCSRMVDRGPDGGGVAAHPDATLGMRRLAIVDIAGGEQPMWNDDGSTVIVYNGEVYNASAVRARLEKEGVRFRTRSDTEVVLRLYERDPERVEEELVGMWAFAIHDRRRRRVRLSRDRFGIKPLFWADVGGRAAFASELRCFDPIRADAPGTFAFDAEAAHAMLAWSYVPETSTIYRGVRRVPPATRVDIDLATGKQRSRTYWSLRPSTEASRVGSLEDAMEFIEPILKRAAQEHLESDVPIASFVSGGIDSALVTAYAVEQSTKPIEAFSIGFREQLFDESPAARATAARLGVQHHVEYLDEDIARSAVADALLSYDEPFGDSSAVATYLLARTVAKTHKVALAGDGGDEVFAGYRKHKILGVRRALGRTGLRPLVAQALATIPARTDRTSRILDTLRTAARLARGLEGTDAEANAMLAQVVPLARAAPLVELPTTGERFLRPAIERFGRAVGDDLQRTLACDLASPLANDMLTKVDRATMAVSLEARVPFLDHRVVEAGLGLPRAFTLPGGKRVLRALHERKFGAELARRRKQGFGVPVEKWLRGPLAAACDALFETKRLERFGLLSRSTLGGGGWRVVAERDAQVLWHAFALAVWCEARHGEGEEGWVRGVLAQT
jgi:asparagine synthase (glutamine-hydrolysing)